MKLSKKSRKLLRVICRGLGAVTVPLTLGACPFPFAAMYGPPPPCCQTGCVFISGRVVSKNTGQPISGIAIWIDDGTSWISMTDSDGGFYIHLPEQYDYTIVFTDVDGTANGLFRQHTINMTRAETEALDGPMLIELEEVEADEE